jgi:polyisoprenoid-binding protein YceI
MIRPIRFALATLSVALMLPSLSFAAAQTFEIDNVHSHVGFKVRHLVANTPGQFNDYTGTVQLDPAAIEKTLKFTGTVQTTSVNTENEKRDGHLRSVDFFDVETHPEMTLVSKSVTKDGDGYKVLADLTLRGVTKEVPLRVTVATGKNPWSGTNMAGLEISGVVNRKDFGMEWNKTLDAGGLLLGDEVKLDIQLETSVPAEKES